MIVVSDTSALSNLIQVQQLPILAALFKQIVIPQEVYKELCEITTQKQLIDNQNWILVQLATNQTKITELKQNLDDGEAEAIALALEINSDYLLIDELKGRNMAERHGIKIVGLLGILIKAKQQGILTAIKPIMEQLLIIGFRIKPTLFDRVLKEVNE